MYNKIVITLFILCTAMHTAAALENNVYTQTLSVGSEEYFVEDNSLENEQGTKTDNAQIQYVENNYNYYPQMQYCYSGYLYPYCYNGYTVIGRPYYIKRTPTAAERQNAQRPAGENRSTARPFAYNYGNR